MSADLSPTIIEKATTPAEVRTDEASVKARSLGELIEADKYLRKIDTTRKPIAATIRITTLDPPGTV